MVPSLMYVPYTELDALHYSAMSCRTSLWTCPCGHDNRTKFLDKFQFEITFHCTCELDDDLEFIVTRSD